MDVITVKELQALGMSCTALDKLGSLTLRFSLF